MSEIETIGQIGNVNVRSVTLTGGNGLRVKLLTYGARLAELWVADRKGQLDDIVLGQDNLAGWQTYGTYVGAICGRYANRIAGGRFTLDGREVQVDRNEGAQHLHGGAAGFDMKVWEIESHSASHATFTTTAADGEMGYPGALTVRATYRIDESNRLWIEMAATTDAPTVINLVNHAYFNLAGQGQGDALGQHLRVEAKHYLPVDATLIPTGEMRAVAGGAFDFSALRPIGQSLPGEAGFDHNLCLSSPQNAEGVRPCAEAVDPVSGRRFRLSTNQVGVQFYTGAHFNGGPGKAGAHYPRFAGFALETQAFPDSPNQPQFPPARLDPGQSYRHLMCFDFTPAPL